MKNILNYFVILTMLLTSSLATSQENPFRIGVKVGYPNVIGGNIEYVTPFLNKRLAPSIEYSIINKSVDVHQVKFSYFQAGFNYYFFKEGKGLYGSLSYGVFNAKLTLNELESDSDPDVLGSANTTISNNSLNLKIGIKSGNRFYFRPEIGYSFTPIAKTLVVETNFPDGSTETQSLDVPDFLSQGLIFNLGFGISF